jgi:hypothetical protein
MSDNTAADPLGLREFVTSTLKSILTDQEPDMLVNYVLMLISNEKTLQEIEKELATEKEEYPKLFGMVLDPRHSPAMLYAMLAQLEAIERGAK